MSGHESLIRARLKYEWCWDIRREEKSVVEKSKLYIEGARMWKEYARKNGLEDRKLPGTNDLCKIMTLRILWQGNPLAVNSTFGSSSCMLCSKERHYIMQAELHNKENLLNGRREMGNACQHQPRVHRLRTVEDGADESLKDEKVNDTNDS